MRKNLKKISIVVKNITGSEVTLTHKAESVLAIIFFQLFCEQIKKGVIYV